ncbi:hypothetical protein LTR66_012681 [Elasticomyces elasticus]|nr:hypothetical protein LTR66_012681 [Elasticomyces elasticus]
MSNFDPNAILRGVQLTLVGALRALKNPALFTSDHYRQAAIAVAAGLAIRLVVAIPIVGVQLLIWIVSLFKDLEGVTWDDDVLSGLHFIEHSVLQVPFFLMSIMRYFTPTLDDMFMDSLRWVDQTYVQKHKSEDPDKLRAMYYPNMRMYSTHGFTASEKSPPWGAARKVMARFGRKAVISIVVYTLSYVPYVGRFVLPAASFYTFNNAVGTIPAAIIFGSGIFVPKRYFVMFIQSYFSSRALMRDLLEPYFSRIRYTKEQKRTWFRDREGVLFGFGVGFYLFLKIPLLGVLIYGIAEASTAYLVTKITDPPPPPAEWQDHAESSVRWRNKHEFLTLPLSHLDANNVQTDPALRNPVATEPYGKRFT